jgi:hypothetical protein
MPRSRPEEDTMKKHVYALIAALAVILSGLTFATPAANADAPSHHTNTVYGGVGTFESSNPGANKSPAADDNNCDQSTESAEGVQYVYTTCASASATSKDVSIAKAKARHTADGRLVLSFIMPDGMPKEIRHGCDTIPAGHAYVNDYYDSLGNRHWVKKIAPPGGVKICFDGHVWRVVLCGNQVIWKKIGRVHSMAKGSYAIRRKQKLYAKAMSEAESQSHSSVVATQQTGPCAGSSASADAEASGTAKAVAKVSAWSMSELKVAVEGTKGNLQVQVVDKATADAKTIAKTRAHTNVEAKIVCNAPPAQPSTPAPVLSEITTVNDVVVNNSRTLDVSGSVAPNHGGTLTCSATYGSITAGKTQSVSGQFTKQITYTAPSEVPAGGHDSVTCNLMQDDGQHDQITSNQFEIRPAPVDPL